METLICKVERGFAGSGEPLSSSSFSSPSQIEELTNAGGNAGNMFD